jgi:rubrerythrin
MSRITDDTFPWILKFQSGKNWFDTLRSEKTKEIYLTRLRQYCDAVGKPIGGGFKHCPKCQIYFCFLCSYELMCAQKKLPLECPMCGGKLTQ